MEKTSEKVIDIGPRVRAARVAGLQRELMAKQAELVQLLQHDELTAQAAFGAEVEVIAAAAPVVPPAPPGRRRRRPRPRRHKAAPATTPQDIEAARQALRQKGMLPR